MRLSSLPPGFSFARDGLLWQSMMAVFAALLLLLSFPPYELSYLAWVSLAPLLNVIAGGVSARRALWLGWLFGIEFTFFAENWIAHSMTRFGQMLTVIAYAVALLFAAILAVFPAIFAAVIAKLTRRFGWGALALAPVVWVVTEWLRPIVTGVTWNALGISQARHFRIASLSQLGGVYLVSSEIVAVSALIVLSLRFRERPVARATVVLFLFAAVFFMLPPQLRRQQQAQEGAEVTAIGVQPNLAPDSSMTGRDLENNVRLTKEAINRAPDKRADIVIWAESPLALFYENDSAIRERLDALARETGSYLIVSTATQDDRKYFNSVHTISPRSDPQSQPRPLRRYDKIRLAPFGEYVPWRPVLGRFVPTIVGDFTPGQEVVVNTLRLETERASIALGGVEGGPGESSPAIERTTNYVRVGSFICYEAAYPNLVRRFVQNGATLLVNVSNDAWFGNTAGARQHLMHAVMRAIENDRDLLRATNSGISAMITADGRVIDPLPMFTAGAQVWQARTRRDRTIYTQYGDWFAIGCAILTVIALTASFIDLSSRSGEKDR